MNKLLFFFLLFLTTSPKVYAYEVYEIGKQYGIDPTVLKAMAKIESNRNSREVGDEGHSHGLYQINIKYHKVTIKQARDIEWATHWTCRNLIRNGYHKNKFRAVMRHNGNNKRAEKYARRVIKMAEKYKNKP